MAPDADVSADALFEVVAGIHALLHPTRGEPPRIELSSRLENDLGLDSLGRAEVIQRCERRFGRRLPDGALAFTETVGDLLEAVRAAPRTRAGVAPAGPPIEASIARRARPRFTEVPATAETLVDVLTWHAERHPAAVHAVLLADANPIPVTYGELRENAARVAAGLEQAGISASESVALMLPTSVAYLEAFFGVLLAGAVPVPIYPPARPSQLEEHIDRHARVLESAEAHAIITSREVAVVARAIGARTGTVRRTWSVDELARGGRAVATPRVRSATDTALIQYTSGSTGSPKGVVLSHANLLANIRIMGSVIRASQDDVFVSWLPLYHDMGLIGAWLGSLYFGCLLVLMPPTSFLTRPVQWLRAIHDFRATLTASPNFGYELCARRIADEDLEGLDLASLRLALDGAEAIDPDTLERFARRYAPYGLRREALAPVYGLAEAAVGLTFPPLGRGPLFDRVDRRRMVTSGEAIPAAPDDATALRFAACGRPLPGYEIRIVDAAGHTVPERVEGTLLFKGPSATRGYERNPEATARLFREGWLDTGDLAYLAGGEVYITGRVKDIVIRRGRHVYPEDVERVVGELADVRRGCVAAFGVRDAEAATERLVVVAETRLSGEERRADLTRRINACIVGLLGEPPDEIVLAKPHTVLKTSSGKLRRGATRAAYESGTLERPPTRTLYALELAARAALSRASERCDSIARAAYGVYVWLVAAAFAVPVLLMILTAGTSDRAWRRSHRAARWLQRACGIRLRAIVPGALEPRRPYILVANHSSYADGICLAALLERPHRFVAKTELERVPVVRRILTALGTVFVERREAPRSVREVERMAGEIARGSPLIVFPEGTFTRAAVLRPFHLGAFEAAVAAGVPVIPVALRGTRALLADGRWLPRRGPVDAVIGPPLAAAASEDPFAAAVRLRDAARAHILLHCGEPALEP